MAILPPGVQAGQFEAAVRAFGAAVGPEWVFTSEEDLGPYRDSFSTVWDTGEERRASAAVAPDTVEQVQAVVRIAGRHRIPLFPISTGKNFGYGGPAPNLHGSVIVDLKRMNRVIEIDAERH
ncbi:MAG: FAD-binding protein, partial [Gammaproteobacteria bacterium]|nr:FAD-binding protein [Gammaproteobacteria bacterium]